MASDQNTSFQHDGGGTSHRSAVIQDIRDIFRASGNSESGSIPFDKNGLIHFQERMKRSVAIAEKYHFPAKYFFNCSRADILAANVKTLEDMMMDKVNQLEQHDQSEDAQKKLTKVVRLLLPLATHPHIKKPLMLVLSKLGHVNPGFLTSIAGDPELYQQAPLNVIRQLWSEFESMHQQELNECIQAYQTEWLNQIQESHQQATSLLHSNTRIRRGSFKPLLRVAFVIGSSRKLYQQTITFLRKRCRSTAHPYLSALRIDMYMSVRELHRRHQGYAGSAGAASTTVKHDESLASGSNPVEATVSLGTGSGNNANPVASSTSGTTSGNVSNTLSPATSWLTLVDTLVLSDKNNVTSVGGSAALAYLRPEKDPSETDALAPVIWLLDYCVNRGGGTAYSSGSLTRAQTQKLCLITRDIIQAKESNAWELSRIYCDCHVQYLIVSTIIRSVFRIRRTGHLPRNSNRIKFLVEVMMMSLRHSVSNDSFLGSGADSVSDGSATIGVNSIEKQSLSEKMEVCQKIITCEYLPLLLQFHIACRRLNRKEKLLKLKKNRGLPDDKLFVILPSGVLTHPMSPFLLQYVLMVSIEDGNWIAARSILQGLIKHQTPPNETNDGANPTTTTSSVSTGSNTMSLSKWRIDCLQSVVALLTSLGDDRKRNNLLSLLHELFILALNQHTSNESDNHLHIDESFLASGGTDSSSERPLQVSFEQLVFLYVRVVLTLPKGIYLEERRQCALRLQNIKTHLTSSLDEGEEPPPSHAWLSRLDNYITKVQTEISQQEELSQAFSPPPKTSLPNFSATNRFGRPVGPQFTPMPTPMEVNENEVDPQFSSGMALNPSMTPSFHLPLGGMESPPKYSPAN